MTAQQKRTLRTEPMQLPFHDRLVRIVPEPTSLARDALLRFFPSQIDATHAVSYSGLLPFAAVKHRQTTCILYKLLNGTCNSNVFNSLSCLGSASDLHTVALETQSMQPLDKAVCHDGHKVQASR